jgi:sugar lactone lactonase YvrE
VLSRQSQLLFTLYTEGSAEHLYSFVHTLGLFNGVWCINLPRQLGLETSAGTLALAPDEKTLYVVSNEGRIAEIGTDIDTQLEVARWVDLGVKGGAVSDVPAIAVDRDSVWVALDRAVVRVDRDGLAVAGELPLPEAASAIAVAPAPPGDAAASERLYVAGASTLYELDAGNGAVLRQVALPAGHPPIDRLTIG